MELYPAYERKGIVPGLLERWYDERKEMQKELKNAKDNDGDVEYWDKRQLVKKINLNSLYGAILQSGCRFFDYPLDKVQHLQADVLVNVWQKL